MIPSLAGPDCGEPSPGGAQAGEKEEREQTTAEDSFTCKRRKSQVCVIFESVFGQEIKPGNSASSTRVGYYSSSLLSKQTAYFTWCRNPITNNSGSLSKSVEGVWRPFFFLCSQHVSFSLTSRQFKRTRTNSNIFSLEQSKTRRTSNPYVSN